MGNSWQARCGVWLIGFWAGNISGKGARLECRRGAQRGFAGGKGKVLGVQAIYFPYN